MATQPVDNIDAVLGRFQAWSGARTATEAKVGIREIPYEEALASERYRWKGVRANAAGKPESKVVSDADEPERRKAAPDPKPRTAKKVRARGHGRSARESKADSQAGARVAAAARPAAKARKGTVEKSAGGVQRAAKAEPAFREVLAEAVKPAEVVVPPQAADLARQAAISIRLGAAERSLIQTRAAEAGTTVSAYMRQCALEVEQMREQVRQVVAAMEDGAPAAAPVAGPAQALGFFARLTRRFFPKKTPVLALKA